MSTGDILYVFADIETESLQTKKLLQIAAITNQGEKFCIYINPQQELPLSCTNFCGFYMYKGRLHRNGVLLPSVNVQTALKNFSDWLSKQKRPLALVFHNGFSFDCNVLARFFLKFDIAVPCNLVKVIDTLPCFRKHIKATTIKDHKLSTLAQYFNTEHVLAHDALDDSIVLKNICETISKLNKISLQEFFENHERSFNYFLDKARKSLKDAGCILERIRRQGAPSLSKDPSV